MQLNNTFPINLLKCTKPLYAASKSHEHSNVNKPNMLKSVWQNEWRCTKWKSTLWQQMALKEQQKCIHYPGNPVNKESALLSEIYLISCCLAHWSALSFFWSRQWICLGLGDFPTPGLGRSARYAHSNSVALHGIFKQPRYKFDGVFSILTAFRNIKNTQVSPSGSILKVVNLVKKIWVLYLQEFNRRFRGDQSFKVFANQYFSRLESVTVNKLTVSSNMSREPFICLNRTDKNIYSLYKMPLEF